MRSLKELMPGWRSSPASVSVLIVDDETSIRQVARAYMDAFGFTDIREAGSGEEALQLAHKHQPDVIVLDYMMPIMDGETVAKHLRSLSPKTMILVFSGVMKLNPPWADGFVDKLDIATLPDQAMQLVSLRRSLERFEGPRTRRAMFGATTG
jgi:CheY-like chemotaxis protein